MDRIASYGGARIVLQWMLHAVATITAAQSTGPLTSRTREGPDQRDGQRVLRRRVEADVGFDAAVFLLGPPSTVTGRMLGDRS